MPELNLWEVKLKVLYVDPNTGEEIKDIEVRLITAPVWQHAHDILSYVIKGLPSIWIIQSIRNLGIKN